MKIDPKRIKIGTPKPVKIDTPELVKIDTPKPVKIDTPKPLSINAPQRAFSEEGFSYKSQAELFKQELKTVLTMFETFVSSPGKLRLVLDGIHYVNPGYGIYHVETDTVNRVNVLKLFSLYLMADRKELLQNGA